MSAGSPIIPVRLPKSLLEKIDAEIAKVNLHWNVTPYNRSSWIIAAIKDKLKHANRSRKAGRNNKKKLDKHIEPTLSFLLVPDEQPSRTNEPHAISQDDS